MDANLTMRITTTKNATGFWARARSRLSAMLRGARPSRDPGEPLTAAEEAAVVTRGMADAARFVVKFHRPYTARRTDWGVTAWERARAVCAADLGNNQLQEARHLYNLVLMAETEILADPTGRWDLRAPYQRYVP